jgi:hypothetical protein
MNGLLPFVGTGVAGRHPIAQDRRIESAAAPAATICLVCRFGDTPSVPSLLPIEPGRVRPADVGIALSVLGGLMAVVAVIFGLANRARPRRQTR